MTIKLVALVLLCLMTGTAVAQEPKVTSLMSRDLPENRGGVDHAQLFEGHAAFVAVHGSGAGPSRCFEDWLSLTPAQR